MVALSDKTVLANFSVSRWGVHRYDKKASDEVHKSNEAAPDTGNYNKRLLPREATAKISAAVNVAREYHRMHTLPWLDDGARILPASKYMDYAAKMKDFRQDFETEVKEFIKQYPQYVKAAKSKMGKLFDPADYPDAKTLLAEYSWHMTILPFPDANDFRVQGVQDLDKIKADMQKRMEAVWENAMSDLGARIVEVVGRMSERLKAFKPGKPGKRAEGTFKDSLVENVRELAEILPSLNVTNDKKLAKIIAVMNSELCKHDAEMLRDDDKVRAKVATSADAVLTAVSDFIA